MLGMLAALVLSPAALPAQNYPSAAGHHGGAVCRRWAAFDVVGRIFGAAADRNSSAGRYHRQVGGGGGNTGRGSQRRRPTATSSCSATSARTREPEPVPQPAYDRPPISFRSSCRRAAEVLTVRKDLPADNSRSSSPTPGQPGKDPVRLGRRRFGHACCLVLLNAAVGAETRHACALSRRRSGDAGHVADGSTICFTVAIAIPQIDARTVKALAILSTNACRSCRRRSAREQGLEDVEVDSRDRVLLAKGHAGGDRGQTATTPPSPPGVRRPCRLRLKDFGNDPWSRRRAARRITCQHSS